MSQKNDADINNPHYQPDMPELGDDFEVWMRGQKEHKNFVELKNQLDTHAQLTDLKEFLGSLGKKSLEKQEQSGSSSVSGNISSGKQDTAFTERIYTRHETDTEKNLLKGTIESLVIPLRAVKDGFFDLAKFVSSPLQETKRTIVYLESESSAKIL